MSKVFFHLPDHNAYEVTPVRDNILRVRYHAGGSFGETLTERYELLDATPEEITATLREEKEGYCIEAGRFTLSVSPLGVFSLSYDGAVLLRSVTPFRPQENEGCGARITIEEDERFYGGGYRPNNHLELRGQILKNWAAPVVNNGPAPWILSSKGWGLFFNHTGETYFDVGYRRSDELVAWSERGELDFFFMIGDLKTQIAAYTTLLGRSAMMPLFGYGITTANNEAEDQNSLFAKAERLRQEKIPCDTFSISCEWMSKNYDCSVNQKFDTSRYFITPWMTMPDQTFIGALAAKGIKTTLWSSCDYDLTYEQERRYFAKHPEAKKTPLYDRNIYREDTSSLTMDANSHEFRDEKLMFIKRHDPNTVPEEAWCEHFKRFFDLGVVGIAEDGSYVEATKIDHCYGNGYTYREMHNLAQVLNAYQYYHIYREYKNKRIFVRTPSTFIANQRFCGTWCGDTTANTSLMGLMQYSFQGMSNVTADLISRTPEQIHFGMLMPWVLNFCWGHMVWPWMLSDHLREMYVFYARLRYALMPYLYTAARHAHLFGLTMARAMVIEYPDDPRFFDCYTQYMLGDALLVGTERTLHLPKGRWVDLFTGKRYEGGITVTDGYPANRGGYLFVKEGAILPLWEGVEYVGQKPIDSLTVAVFPQEEGAYTLYEDDGISFDYERGAYAETRFSYRREGGRLTVTVEPSRGEYEGKPPHRTYHIEVYTPAPAELPPFACYDAKKGAVCFTIEDAGNVTI